MQRGLRLFATHLAKRLLASPRLTDFSTPVRRFPLPRSVRNGRRVGQGALLIAAWVLVAALEAHADLLLSPIAAEHTTAVAAATRGIRRVKRFSIDHKALADLRGRRTAVIAGFPLGGDRTVDLEVTSFNPLAPISRVDVFRKGKARAVRQPDNVYFRGTVRGEPDSRVVLIAGPATVRGIVQSGDDTYAFGPTGTGTQIQGYALRDVDPAAMPGNVCAGADDPAGMPAPETAARTVRALGLTTPTASVNFAAPLVVDVAIDTDYELFQKFAVSDPDTAAQRLTDYLDGLVASASVIYQRDVNVELRLAYVRIFTDADDPWFYPGDDVISQNPQTLGWVKDYWRTYGADLGAPAFDALTYVSGKTTSQGSASTAYLGRVCDTVSGGPANSFYGVSLVQAHGPLTPEQAAQIGDPDQIWDMFAYTHELGHILGSPHTNCYAPPVDRCVSGERYRPWDPQLNAYSPYAIDCYQGTPESTRGTVMSRCSAIGGLAIIDLKMDYSLHGPVSSQMREVLEVAACVEPPQCGDGYKNANEQCDDGNMIDGDGCDHNCTPTGCGNEVITAGEACDDGNTLDGDCCSSTCQITNDTLPCDDGNQCTTGDICSGGTCAGSPATGTPCDDGEICTTGDVCTAGVCGGTQACSLDHFLTYKAKVTSGTPKFAAVGSALGTVDLTSDFATATVNTDDQRGVTVSKPVALGLPTDKNGEGILDPLGVNGLHLEEYQVKTITAGSFLPAGYNVTVQNQCGTVVLTKFKPVSLMVPTAKNLTMPVSAPGSPALDHFECYSVKLTTTSPKLAKGIQVTITDQFMTNWRLDLKKVKKLCVPVDKQGTPLDKNGAPPAAFTPATRHAPPPPLDSLLCYQAKRATKTITQNGCGPATPGDSGVEIVPAPPKHTKVLGMHTNNQLGPLQLDSIKENEFCVPSVTTCANCP